LRIHTTIDNAGYLQLHNREAPLGCVPC